MAACGTNPATQWGYGYSVAYSGWGQCGESGTSTYRWGEPLDYNRRATTQNLLKQQGLYSGPIDGIWGANTIKGIMRVLANKGYYSGPIDGIPGSATVTGVGNYACNWGGPGQSNYTTWNQHPTLEDVAMSPSRQWADTFFTGFNNRLAMRV